ncbi:DksA/TraR family C4-type zinc finger protein [Desulfospira joergensenii]|uniref:DksA/TraR family C4-type zinc finger protein n=1 Tax=Desulfospira joergensenii TaxID=53329 RepID=UPI0003B50037|nr:DksA/TraR family C4-type zinc finger protein [Desulfospira joergensenii]
MAVGWAGDGAVQEQIDAGIEDEIKRARSRLSRGKSLTHCRECGEPIPPARQKAVPGVQLCIDCQTELEEGQGSFTGFNRRGSKDSQLK